MNEHVSDTGSDEPIVKNKYFDVSYIALIYIQIIGKIARYAIPSCSALNETNKTYLYIKIHIGNV